jgi:hypothetical protein
MSNPPLSAGAQDNPAVAIIDTPADTRTWLQQLKQQQVAVVIRYAARAWQKGLPNKRIASNGPGDPLKDGHYFPGTGGSEADQLYQNGLGIILVYEDDGGSDPCKFLFGHDQHGTILQTGDPHTDHAKVAANEADVDAAAANQQAGLIGQPNAPVYFAIDFDLFPGTSGVIGRHNKPIRYSNGTPVSNDKLVAACTAYFQQLKTRLGVARLGVYGNGFISETLLGLKLVTYVWISQSVSFRHTANVLRNGVWHLFQQADWNWFVNDQIPPEGLDVDTDIQNPNVTDIGAFNAAGPFLIPAARTQAIFDKRSVAVSAVPLHTQKDPSSPLIQKPRMTDNGWGTATGTSRHASVRVLEDDGTWLAIDLDEDGVADGYALKAANFVPTIKNMPDW